MNKKLVRYLKDTFDYLVKLAKFVFFVSLACYLILYFINSSLDNFIWDHFNLNIILIIFIISGVILALGLSFPGPDKI